MNHDVYLLVAFATHAAVGYAAVRGLGPARGRVGLLAAAGVAGALLPDADLYLGPLLGLPVVHRGALHTPAALVVAAVGLSLVGSVAVSVVESVAGSAGRSLDASGPRRDAAARRVAAALGVGFLTHLLIDSFTDAGIMWLYPASTARVALGIPIHGAAGTAALWLTALALVLVGPRLGRRVRDGDPSDR